VHIQGSVTFWKWITITKLTWSHFYGFSNFLLLAINPYRLSCLELEVPDFGFQRHWQSNWKIEPKFERV